MEIQHSMRDGCLVLSFTGGIDLLSVSAVQRTVLKTSATPSPAAQGRVPSGR